MTAEPKCSTVRLGCGLTVCTAEMQGFGTACAQLGTRFGSAHLQYRSGGRLVALPPGTAHFLEHQLFKNEDGDVDYQFAALGAASNAYTEFDRTVYHFRTAEHFPEALALLLDFVQRPYFAAESVENERSIIAQELDEALDDPDDRLFFTLLEGLYHTHPVRFDAVGTHESIRQITPEILHRSWESFYRPQNMILCCAGDLHAETVCETAERLFAGAPPMQAETLMPEEPETVAHSFLSRKMSVGKPLFAVGFKCPPVTGDALERTVLLGTLALELIAGSASPFTEQMLSEGLLTDALSVDCSAGDGWFTLFLEGESDDPQAVTDALLREIETARQQGLDAKRFGTLRRCGYGDLLISRNSPPAMADAMMQAAAAGLSAHDLRLRLLRQITLQDAEACMAALLRPDRMTLAVIEPA